MKKFFFSLLASLAMLAPLIAGETYRSSNERQQVAPECPQWYADTEFNLTLSGAYGMTANSWHEDAYLGVDHAWGASIEAKYFFRRYFAVGVQGTLLWVNDNETFDNGFVRFQSGDKDRHTVGTMLGTFTVRIPINCSRFAPYGWVGGGGI